MAPSHNEINNLRNLADAGVMLQSADISLRNVRVNGTPLARLSAIEQWAVDLGYREAAHMAAYYADEGTPRP